MRAPMGVDGPRRPARHPVITLFLVAAGLAVSWMAAGCSQPVAGAGAPDSAAPPVHPPPGPAAPLRLATFNIRWGLGADGVRDLTRTAAVLRAMDADIVLLNEVDVHWRRSGNKDQPAYLAQAAGYPYMYFGPALRTWASGGPRLSLYGNLLLSRYPLQDARTIALPTGPGREPRAAVAARVVVGGRTLTVLGTHLGLNQAERLLQTARLRELAAGQPGPVVVMGDFNARPGAPEIQQLTAGPGGLVDTHQVAGAGPGLTFPAGQPAARIDYVFVSPDLASLVLRASPWPTLASDHLPVVVDLAWPQAP
ncbi:MAG TPA: endonuclease/exonuclease/phosphatase family protein [Limnochordales bacterium]|nr:endonuclease/exonuclease/phosphatase family protein [Limnochordales bacterium]